LSNKKAIQQYNKLYKYLEFFVKENKEFNLDKFDEYMCEVLLDGYFFANISVQEGDLAISFNLDSTINDCLFFFQKVLVVTPDIIVFEPTYFSVYTEEVYFGEEAYDVQDRDLKRRFEKESFQTNNEERFKTRH
jgi:hypothetical protein